MRPVSTMEHAAKCVLGAGNYSLRVTDGEIPEALDRAPIETVPSDVGLEVLEHQAAIELPPIGNARGERHFISRVPSDIRRLGPEYMERSFQHESISPGHILVVSTIFGNDFVVFVNRKITSDPEIKIIILAAGQLFLKSIYLLQNTSGIQHNRWHSYEVPL